MGRPCADGSQKARQNMKACILNGGAFSRESESLCRGGTVCIPPLPEIIAEKETGRCAVHRGSLFGRNEHTMPN